MPDQAPLLRVREVSKSFGAVAAVRNVSLDLYGAKAAGIAVIYQEPTLFPDLSVAENIAIGRQPLGRFKTIDRTAMLREAAQLFTRLGVSIEPNRPARGLSIANQQLGEIGLGPPTEFTATNIDTFDF